MKKIIFMIVALMAMITAEAKVVKITLTDGTTKVFTSSELSAIDFNDDGTLTITTYDGQQLEALGAAFDAVEIGSRETISMQTADTLRFESDGIGLSFIPPFNRPIEKLNYVYPSQDPWGEPISLSGTILIPEEIMKGERKCEGILLFNHYTKFHRDEAPTVSNGGFESIYLANPLYPNYIIVESDFYGFGATVRFPQAFVQGLVNARASLDGLLAARRLLDEMDIDYGPLCFNLGYSSGGFDAMNTQKLRDMEYADLVTFDKTFAGGGPNDVRECYRQYVEIDSSAYNAVPLLLMVSTKETQKLDMEYTDVFHPYIADKIDEWVLSKNYSSWPVCDSIGREKKIHEILTADYCDLNSEKSLEVQELFRQFSIATDDWTPDPSQRIYLMHSRGDDYVPIQSARPVIGFLRDRGFQPSIIPGKTNFQTNFVVRDLGHLTATVVYYVQSLAAIKAWPKMYTDNKLNPIYQALVSQDFDPVMMMRRLDAMGFDCRKIITTAFGFISSMMPEGEGGQLSFSDLIALALDATGFTPEEIIEMSEDSGIDISKLLIDLATYFYEADGLGVGANDDTGSGETSDDENNAAKRAVMRMNRAFNAPTTPDLDYEQQLRDWLQTATKH